MVIQITIIYVCKIENKTREKKRCCCATVITDQTDPHVPHQNK